jgi:hypothetical protein
MNQIRRERHSEQGIALITALMVSTILLGLGMAIALSVTTDTTINNSHRIGEQAFFSADAGVAIARRALATALGEEILKIKGGEASYGDGGFVKRNDPPASGAFPDVRVIPDPSTDKQNPFFTQVYARTRQLFDLQKRKDRLKAINGSSFTLTSVAFTTGSVGLVDPGGNSATATEAATLRYTLVVQGTTEAGGKAEVIESGLLSTEITLSSTLTPGTDRTFSFSGFGAFFDNGDSTASSALASGTFSGPVHTNTHFAFRSTNSVTFRNSVTQVDNYIRYDSNSFNQGQQAIPTKDKVGIDISSEGYKKIGFVPLPENNFSQEYAVINASGITDLNPDGSPVDPPGAIPVDKHGNPLPVFGQTGRVTAEALQANLRTASNTKPSITGSSLASGVYISSVDGASVSGAGIYVQGDATDLQLTAGTNGTDQVYVIKQNSTTTTITVSSTLNTTTIASGSKTATFSGVPMDRSDPKNPKPGVSLFVNGSISSLRGGVNGSTNRAAIAPGTRLTVTAQRDITVTGDLKYANPVAASDGAPVANVNAITNVLGIFTNDGNVNLAPVDTYTAGSGLSLEMNAAVVSFNKNTQNDSGEIEGSIVYTGTTPKSNETWKLVGSRVQSKINNIGFATRNIFFDVRFSGGKFAPPFFPGTSYDLGEEEVVGEDVTIGKVTAPNPTSVSWYRRSR